MKTPRGCSERSMTSNCVRFDDKRGFSCRLNKTGLRSLVRKKLFSYYVKCYEQECRGDPVSAVLKKFEIFKGVSERFPPLTPLPLRFGLMEPSEKQSTLMQLVSDQLDDAERICSQFQGVDTQAGFPDDMQVGEGSETEPASEGVANTPPPPADSSLQNVSLESVRSEGSLGVPPSSTLGPGSCILSQLDNPEGRPPPRSRQCPDGLNQSISDMECRASKFPDMLSEFDWLKQRFILFEKKLKDREMNERLSLESRRNPLRKSLEEIHSQLPEGMLTEDPQNQLRKASMEDVGFQRSYYPASDIGVKKIETPMPEDGLLRDRSISEALEVVPRFTGRYRKNVGDIRPEVYGGSGDGDLPSKPIMEGFSPQASDLQVNDLCSGGENFVIMPNRGGNNTLLSVPIDRFVSAAPSADEREQWACWQLGQFDFPVEELGQFDMPVEEPGQFDMPVEEGWRYYWHSPVRHVSIDTLPA